MNWLCITAVCFLATRVKSGPIGSDGEPEALNIMEIDRGDQAKFTFTLSKQTPEGTTHSILVVKKAGKEFSFNAAETEPSQSLTFDAELIQFSGSSVDFLIMAKDKQEEDVAYAEADDIPFPDFPEVNALTYLDDPRNPSKSTLIRLQGTLGTMSLKKTDILITGDLTNYYSFTNADPTDYTPCNNDGSVPVCDDKLDASPTENNHDPMVSSAVLAYGPDDKATIKLSLLNAGATHEAILIPQSLQSLQSPEKNVLCTDKQFTETTCTIDWLDSSITALQLIIIQKPTTQDAETDTWATSTFDIHDRQLAVTQLGADIIEGRWLMLDGEYSSDDSVKSIYRLQKTKTSTTPLEDQEIDVDCSHLALEPRLCFGYFPHVDPGTYTLTVAYKGTGDANEMDQIESSPVRITPSKPELEILSRHTTTLQNQQRADVQICFQHLTPTEGRSFSHYEMLIINEKGQWLKHSIMQEEEEEESNEEKLCFASFNINTKDFDLTEGTKVIISQRGVDGVSVLASGESALF